MGSYNEVWFQERREREARFQSEEELKSIELSPGQRFALDYKNRLLCVGFKTDLPMYFQFSELDSVDIHVDEVNSSGKSTSSVLGRAAVFGLLTGGAGAIVGAMTAKSSHKRDIRRVKLSVRVKGEEFDRTHWLYSAGYFKGYTSEDAIKVAERVRARLLEDEPTARVFLSAAEPANDIAKSLAQLAQLHDSGALSDAEFMAAKNKLLA